MLLVRTRPRTVDLPWGNPCEDHALVSLLLGDSILVIGFSEISVAFPPHLPKPCCHLVPLPHGTQKAF